MVASSGSLQARLNSCSRDSRSTAFICFSSPMYCMKFCHVYAVTGRGEGYWRLCWFVPTQLWELCPMKCHWRAWSGPLIFSYTRGTIFSYTRVTIFSYARVETFSSYIPSFRAAEVESGGGGTWVSSAQAHPHLLKDDRRPARTIPPPGQPWAQLFTIVTNVVFVNCTLACWWKRDGAIFLSVFLRKMEQLYSDSR
jgi:hypothetical protein